MLVSTSTNDYYGRHRPGDNLFAESLVALQAETGARVWHFQMVHHGLWDYDLPAAPNLVDITVEGRRCASGHRCALCPVGHLAGDPASQEVSA
jgi:glucose dehydrogenase